MRRIVKFGGVAVALGLLGWIVYYGVFLAKALPNGTGLAAKHLCSLHYLSGLPVQRARELYIDPFVQPLTNFLEISTDREAQTLTAVGFGIATSVARYRQGYGCTLLHDDKPLQPARAARSAPRVVEINADHREQRFYPARLDEALDAAFANEDKRRNTLAVVVFHEGNLVAERYGPDVNPTTPLPGWSMAKSVTATLVGMLADRGALDVYAAGALPEWRASEDPRSAITMDHLLRMTSGLNLVEDQSGADVNSRMLFLEPDSAAFSAAQPLLYEVGSTYDYMSGSTVLASRAVKEATGGTLEASYAWIEENLFNQLHMYSAALEPDQAGTFIGSSFMLASAQDWARLGMLYANGGVYEDKRLLSEKWIEYVLRWTPQSGSSAYGAGLWLNAYGKDGSELRWPALPADAFAMNGFQSQFVYVVPSEKLVVVRLGASTTDPRVRALVKNVISARRS